MGRRLEHQRSDPARVAVHGEDTRPRPAPDAHVGDFEARRGEPRPRRVGVRDAVRDAPGAIGRTRLGRGAVARGQLHGETADAEEEEPSSPPRELPVEREAETEALPVEGARGIRVGRPHDDVVDAVDRGLASARRRHLGEQLGGRQVLDAEDQDAAGLARRKQDVPPLAEGARLAVAADPAHGRLRVEPALAERLRAGVGGVRREREAEQPLALRVEALPQPTGPGGRGREQLHVGSSEPKERVLGAECRVLAPPRRPGVARLGGRALAHGQDHVAEPGPHEAGICHEGAGLPGAGRRSRAWLRAISLAPLRDEAAAKSPAGSARTSALLFAALLFIYSVNGREIGAVDTVPNILLPIAILRGDGPLLNRFDATIRDRGDLPYWVEAHGEQLLSRYPILPALLALPVTWPQLMLLDRVLPDWQQEPAVALSWMRMLAKNAAALVAALTAVLLHRLLLELGLGEVAVSATLATALGSELWMVASQSPWQHGPAAFLLVLSLLLLVPARVSNARLVGAGLAAAAAVCARSTSVVFAAPLAIWA